MNDRIEGNESIKKCGGRIRLPIGAIIQITAKIFVFSFLSVVMKVCIISKLNDAHMGMDH